MTTPPAPPRALLHRVAETRRAPVELRIDGAPAQALAGDTVLTAVLVQRDRLRLHERDATARAGFCLMGACQDCWVQLQDGQRLRACTTPVAPGMDLRTDGGWA
ncbi:(2Fe-2S)-binding protein [Aquabacterium sp. OR-4]|uniref:(2Fe-2S)-binding protein n=1 Tax=Aquabacterium sp. OR-4 TaxID=2978127 RepID=UPI0021B17562|nr:(2Fe-2S)-binding protein [Aquabacterium sp. OR-4]MDT7837935.1 (2Fe-2S)-binding protein [Aquabacterium sp. OR-4]